MKKQLLLFLPRGCQPPRSEPEQHVSCFFHFLSCSIEPSLGPDYLCKVCILKRNLQGKTKFNIVELLTWERRVTLSQLHQTSSIFVEAVTLPTDLFCCIHWWCLPFILFPELKAVTREQNLLLTFGFAFTALTRGCHPAMQECRYSGLGQGKHEQVTEHRAFHWHKDLRWLMWGQLCLHTALQPTHYHPPFLIFREISECSFDLYIHFPVGFAVSRSQEWYRMTY